MVKKNPFEQLLFAIDFNALITMVNGYDLLEKPVISKTKYKIKSTNGGILFYIRICMYVCIFV